MSRCSKKVVGVTGAGSGIGRATSIRFATEDAPVVTVDVDQRIIEGINHLINEVSGAIATGITTVGRLQRA